MQEKLPKIIEEVGFDFDWSEEKVWALDVPVTEMEIDELIWHFNIPFLWWSDDIYNLKPSEVIESPEKYQKEYDRTMESDLSHPIDIMENKGRWLILDGLHRLMKSSILGMEKVNVRIIPRDRIEEIEI